jgi:hypothetical protein
MVDKTEVYLAVKINFEDKVKEIKSTKLLTIEEIKNEIIKLFSLNDNDKNDLELFDAKTNKKLSNNDNIFFLIEEVNDYLYSFEIKLKNKKAEKVKGLVNDIKEIKENNEKIKEMKLEIIKLKMQIEHKKKVKEIQRKINSYKLLNELKDRLTKEILQSSINKINNYFNEINNNIKNKKEKEKKKIDVEIKNKGDELLSTFKEQFTNELNPIKNQLEVMDKQIE